MDSPPPPAAVDARGQLNIPSLLLIVSAGLAILLLVGSTLFNHSLQQLLVQLAPNLREAFEQAERQETAASKLVSYAFTGLLVVLNGLIVYGALQMRNLKNWGLAMTAAVLGVIPCCPTCYCTLLSLPIAIWALVLLNKPEVKAQFT